MKRMELFECRFAVVVIVSVFAALMVEYPVIGKGIEAEALVKTDSAAPQVSEKCPCDGDKQITDLLMPIRQKHKLPALAGAIVTSKGLISNGAVGVRKAGEAIAVTIDDEWHLGSDTKAITATLIGALVERGKLKWDTMIEEVFPEMVGTMQPDLRKVTVVQLLAHRSGLPENLDWQSISRAGTVREQRQAVLKMAGSQKLKCRPGAEFNYSNVGYVIAGAIAEKAADASWEEQITRTIFEPLGMTHAGFGGTGTVGKIDQPWGHKENGKPVAGNGPAMDNPPVLGPAGTVHCPIGDWAKFIADQLHGAQGKRALLQSETYKRLQRPAFGERDALGWVVAKRDWGGGTVLSHAGSNSMNYAVIWLAPERDFAVLVCTNQGGDGAKKACDEAAAGLIGLHVKK